MHGDKKGATSEEIPEILQRLQLDARHWCYLTRHFKYPFKHLMGQHITDAALARYSVNIGYRASASVNEYFPASNTNR